MSNKTLPCNEDFYIGIIPAKEVEHGLYNPLYFLVGSHLAEESSYLCTKNYRRKEYGKRLMTGDVITIYHVPRFRLSKAVLFDERREAAVLLGGNAAARQT